ncbi:MAG TPA: beta-ketoacyl synthase, partial [Agriterribacter sp.]|nr:beta-ketoacyl synthase [Agriterribacter sp.]
MKPVFIIADNILSPLGLTTNENFGLLKDDVSGIQEHDNPKIAPHPFYASLFKDDEDFAVVHNKDAYTKFERLLIASVQQALSETALDVTQPGTALIISSTKGNISLIEDEAIDAALVHRISLPSSAKLIADYFHFATAPIVVSHACISGLVALITGMRLLQSG